MYTINLGDFFKLDRSGINSNILSKVALVVVVVVVVGSTFSKRKSDLCIGATHGISEVEEGRV